jgi:glycosyltransferase involved in cell wall biosynthesis
MLLASRLDTKLFKTDVCAFEHGNLVNYLNDKKIETKVIPKSHSVTHFLRLINFLRKHKPDIVHSHSGGYTCLAAKLAGVKYVVYTKHGIGLTEEALRQRGFFRKIRDFLVDRTVTIYIALTEYDKKMMNRILNIDLNKIEIIWNGIDPFLVKRLTVVKNSKPVIGVVGRLTRQKGISYLIKAIPKIMEKISNIEVLIAGDGEDESMLKKLSKEHGVSDRINFLGYVKNAAEVINGMDVFVLPSIWEGFPYVLLEAMILKKPIVATDIFGIQEIIDNNKNGILVKPKSPDSIAETVIDLLTDKKRAQKLGEAAYKKAIKYYTLEGTVSKIQTLYSYLLEKK